MIYTKGMKNNYQVRISASDHKFKTTRILTVINVGATVRSGVSRETVAGVVLCTQLRGAGGPILTRRIIAGIVGCMFVRRTMTNKTSHTILANNENVAA